MVMMDPMVIKVRKDKRVVMVPIQPLPDQPDLPEAKDKKAR